MVYGDDLAEGRSGPLMMCRCFADLAVYLLDTVVKIDNTIPGIAGGRAAGCITVGISLSGNYFGLSDANVMALPEAERDRLNGATTKKPCDAVADPIIDGMAALPALIDILQWS